MNNVAYLEVDDFDFDGIVKLKIPVPENLPVVVMVQASWCPHCVRAKPAFQRFAQDFKEVVFCATIEVDGEKPGERALADRLNEIKPDFVGFPDYLLYVGGKRVAKEIKGRDVPSLVEFIQI